VKDFRFFARLKYKVNNLDPISRMNTLSLRIESPSAASEAAFANTWETIALQCQFRVHRIAEFCHVSTRTLQRHFRRNYDTTISHWLREVRLEKARRMLREADCIKAVAFDLGYKQPSHFTRDFKQRFGVPPKMWALDMRVQIPLTERRSGPVRVDRRGEEQIADLFPQS
jgi:AraC-like DNA-binding protein